MNDFGFGRLLCFSVNLCVGQGPAAGIDLFVNGAAAQGIRALDENAFDIFVVEKALTLDEFV